MIEAPKREDRRTKGAEWDRVWEGVAPQPLPSRLGGLEERRELPQRCPGQSYRIFCMF